MLKSDWNFCKEKALQLLLKQESLSFPVEPQRLNTGLSIYFDSIQGYCHTVGLPVSVFCNVQMLQDGCTIFSKDHSFYLIPYNEWDKSQYRRRFTLAHELGHILLSHCNDNANSEKLANQFASHLLLPRAALSYIKQRVPFPVLTQLVPFFGVSVTALHYAWKDASLSGLSSPYEIQLIQKIHSSLDTLISHLSEPIVSPD